MHSNTFLEDAKVKIVKVVEIKSDGRQIIADLVTTQFGRVTQKRFKFSATEWETIKERGWIE